MNANILYNNYYAVLEIITADVVNRPGKYVLLSKPS